MIPLESNTGCGMEMTRRAFLGRTSGGLGLAALTGLLQSKTTVNAAEGLDAFGNRVCGEGGGNDPLGFAHGNFGRELTDGELWVGRSLDQNGFEVLE